MTTLITYRPPGGTHPRRCDAKCHNAKSDICKCICSGINHGAGRNQAIDNTREHHMLLKGSQEAGDFIINHAQYQLFSGGNL